MAEGKCGEGDILCLRGSLRLSNSKHALLIFLALAGR